ncbi:hypothetical protein ERJ75_000980000 [Trypanosoma vivax]|uniref:EF-hand domain-containing protein n=1 Tax=Trypanosoma vivax (strain Y486) TaxID=1055687 RepID=G0U6V1_TRYVY|nr:hypothetical protein TRVL_02168 [Trypanosoma vivax]KAH8611228.1 hypothetical protein ERJ75_000980000 [Trypanosoma vivax]CCC51607.1 conserved hypothetical protein [Trypanosoma vivax Y486]
MSVGPRPCSTVLRSRRQYLRFTPMLGDSNDELTDHPSIMTETTSSTEDAPHTTTTTFASTTAQLTEQPHGNLAGGVLSMEQKPVSICTTAGALRSESIRTPANLVNTDMLKTLPLRNEERKYTPSQVYKGNAAQQKTQWRAISTSVIQPLTPSEEMHIELVYDRYLGMFDEECLIKLFEDLIGLHARADANAWLTQLEAVLRVRRDELIGGTLGVKTDHMRPASDSLTVERRKLTHDEVSYFAMWLKCTHGIRIGPQVQNVMSREPSTEKLIRNEAQTPITERKPRNFSMKRCSSTTVSGEKKLMSSVSPAPSASPSVENFPRIALMGEKQLTKSVVPSTRGYKLEMQSFAELGGGADGTGSIRLIELKRMLQQFNFEVNFDSFIGTVIDRSRSGYINFDEFLWVLENGVRGMGPAAAIHENLTARLGGSSVITPPIHRTKSMKREKKDKVQRRPSKKRNKAKATYEQPRHDFTLQVEKFYPYLNTVNPMDSQVRAGRRATHRSVGRGPPSPCCVTGEHSSSRCSPTRPWVSRRVGSTIGNGRQSKMATRKSQTYEPHHIR